jgi:hypothetical protein
MVKRFTARSFDDPHRHGGNDAADQASIKKPQPANTRPVKFSDDSGLLQDPFEIDAAVLRAVVDEAPRQKRVTALQRFSFLTFPVVSAIAVLMWLTTFVFIYDMYSTSFGQASFIDYLSRAPFMDAARQTMGIVFTRNTIGLSLLALLVMFPFIYVWLTWWMLKGGRSL